MRPRQFKQERQSLMTFYLSLAVIALASLLASPASYIIRRAFSGAECFPTIARLQLRQRLLAF
jgi:ABC-type antimicrobial peptide transport system permease subunit